MRPVTDLWDSGDPYEYFMGRWSKLMAPVFLKWLNIDYGLSWLDVGCGTGSLSEAIFQNCEPAKLACIDTSAEFLAKAKLRLSNEVDFSVGSASNIPKGDNEFDVVVSGLALNFFPDLTIALSEMKRVVRTNGTIAAYVWDYAGRMDFLRFFWDAAAEIDPGSHKLDEGVRFPICNTEKLKDEFTKADLIDIETSYLDIKTIFKNFDDFWNPFLGGQGPAGAYLVSLSEELQKKLKNNLFKKIPIQADGTMKLLARVAAVRGIKSQR